MQLTSVSQIKPIKHFIGLLLAWTFMTTSPGLLAQDITLQFKPGIEVHADFRAGTKSKPAILILHGFLQTYNNATVHNLVEELTDARYTVLAPTLSLGITNRKQSLACEAPHTHTFHQDVEEVARWVTWLQQRGHKQIILIGHSTGNIALLSYARQHNNPAIKKLIAISLIEYQREFGSASDNVQLQAANRDARKGDTSLKSYRLSYCNNYLAPAETYITYANWDMQRIIKTIHSIKIPLYIIAGSADERMHDGWLEQLRTTNSIIKQIEGANHFFSSIHQFDLYDQVNLSISD